jgi:glycosyltransferase involved in cell wall biosynthesis
MKILYILDSLGFGGTEKWLLEIVKLNKGTHQIDFLLTGGEKDIFDEEFQENGSCLYYLKFSRKGAIKFILEFNRILKVNKYDVVHNHQDFVAGWHWLFVLPNLPALRIAHAHNSKIFIDNYITGMSRKYFYKIGKVLNCMLSSKITGTSDDVLDQLGYNEKFFLKKRIEPLYCGVNPTIFQYNFKDRLEIRQELGISHHDKVVVFVGRIDCPRQGEINHKNPEFALDIAVQISKFNSNYKFLFVGEKGETGIKMEQNIFNQGLQNQVKFLGKRKDIANIMSASDIFLMTSIKEPFGLVLVEAQFNGLKIISSNVITTEIIESKELFELLPLGNLELWVDTLLSSDWNSKTREEFLESNKGVISNSKFSINASYNRLLRNYQE